MSEKTDSYIDSDKYAQYLGVEVLDVSSDEVCCKLRINESHVNGVGSVHGAVMFALADIAFAVVCNNDQIATGIQADIRYLNRPRGKTLHARARLVSSSKKLAHYQVDITDDNGNRCAQFSGTAYKLSHA